MNAKTEPDYSASKVVVDPSTPPRLGKSHPPNDDPAWADFNARTKELRKDRGKAKRKAR